MEVAGRWAGMGANARCCGRNVFPHKLQVLCVATVTDAKSSLSSGEIGCGVHLVACCPGRMRVTVSHFFQSL